MTTHELMATLADDLKRATTQAVRAQILDSMVRLRAANPDRPAGRHDRPALVHLFSHHTPDATAAVEFQFVRNILMEACIAAVGHVPEGVFRDKAVDAMHLAMMCFNSAIAMTLSVARS